MAIEFADVGIYWGLWRIVIMTSFESYQTFLDHHVTNVGQVVNTAKTLT